MRLEPTYNHADCFADPLSPQTSLVDAAPIVGLEAHILDAWEVIPLAGLQRWKNVVFVYPKGLRSNSNMASQRDSGCEGVSVGGCMVL